MMVRVLGAAAAAVLATATVPAAAQNFSDSYEFLEAIRKADGAKVQGFLRDKTLRIINTRSRDTGEAAIHIVTNRDDALYLRAILQQDDANPNVQDRRGNTALILAAGRGWEEGVGILLRYKANVNLANASGETALIRAVQTRNLEVARLLLAAGADPDRTDNVTGKSARDYAQEQTRFPQLMKLLADAPKTQRGGAMSGPTL